MERLCHILDLPVLHLVCTYPAATGGVKMRLCHVGKVYNFCRKQYSFILSFQNSFDLLSNLSELLGIHQVFQNPLLSPSSFNFEKLECRDLP